MTVLGTLGLLFQVLLLGQGGLTTLGENMFSIAIIEPLVVYSIYHVLLKTRQLRVAIICAAALGILFTYMTTSIQLALAFPALDGGFMASFLKFAGIFALTQIPLAISEGLLTLLVSNWLQSYGKKELETIKLLQG